MNRSNFNTATAIRLGDLYPLTWQPDPDSEPRVFGPDELLSRLKRVADDLPVSNRVDWPIPARIHVYRNYLRNKRAWRLEHFAFLFAGANGQGVYLEALEAGYFKSFDCAARDLWNSMGQKLLVNPLQDEIEQMIAVGVLQDTMVGGTRYFTNDTAMFLWTWLEFQPQIAEACRQMEKHGCGWLDLISESGPGQDGQGISNQGSGDGLVATLDTKGWLTVSVAAERANVAASSISEACDKGRISTNGLKGRARRISLESLKNYIDGHKAQDKYYLK